MPKGYTTCRNCGQSISSRKIHQHEADCIKERIERDISEDSVELSDEKWVQAYEMFKQLMSRAKVVVLL